MTYDPRTIERPQGFVIPTCACGHTVGDHVSATGGLNSHHGQCLTRDCDCREYREARP